MGQASDANAWLHGQEVEVSCVGDNVIFQTARHRDMTKAARRSRSQCVQNHVGWGKNANVLPANWAIFEYVWTRKFQT